MKLTIRQTALILLGSFSVSAAELTLQYDQQQQTTTIPDHHRLADAYAKLKLPADIDWLSALITKEGANKQVISSQADSLIKISRIWADFFPANTSNQPI